MRDRAIYKTHPAASFIEDGVAKDINGKVVVLDLAKVNAELVVLQKLRADTQYQRDRAAEYVLIHWDDLRFNDMRDGTTTEYDTRMAIKAKYPKPKVKLI